jgi:hypothetical protein
MTDPNLNAFVGKSAIGLWQRTSITLEDGSVDDTTRVFWAQTAAIFVDLRVPAGRVGRGLGELARLSVAELATLGQQKGFAGRTVRHGDNFTWLRSIDFHPSSGRPDTGLVRIEGDMLFEQGDPKSALGVGYHEVYRRVAAGDNRRLALELADSMDSFGDAKATRAYLVVIDGTFMFARQRPVELPQSATLTELLAAARGRKAELRALLDCHVALGRVDSGADRWMVDLSTQPWTERRPLFSIEAAELRGSQLRLEHARGSSLWDIRDSSLAPAELLSLFPARR